ncbi:PREDICTED: kinesin-like protein KIF25 [Dipodomys ordii]|uniref:Kinesin-like protein n=1 Tax=Dipodomys ordii TaxID=10020 RepID=A0A1S3FTS5_DIPOR|nr:PREDICTED: kinesin-like protein KIF25 [Dipodomys ordii]
MRFPIPHGYSSDSGLYVKHRSQHPDAPVPKTAAPAPLNPGAGPGLSRCEPELKGNIRVHCRIRPLLPFDKESDREPSGKSTKPVRASAMGDAVLPGAGPPRNPILLEKGGIFRSFTGTFGAGSSNPGEEAARALDEALAATHSAPVPWAVGPQVARSCEELRPQRETVSVTCCRPGQPASRRTYTFERVYGPAESQAAVFGDVQPLLTSLLDGPPGTLASHGAVLHFGNQLLFLEKLVQIEEQGPTEGVGRSQDRRARLWPPHHSLCAGSRAGLVEGRQAAFTSPFVDQSITGSVRLLIAENPPRSPKVEVSIVEIYNNDIYDLLAKDGCTAVTGVRRGVVTTPEGRTEVPLLTCVTVTSAVEFLGLIHGGLQLRVTHPTLVHADSSRSHLVVMATLTTAAVPGSTGPQPGPATRREPAGPARRQHVLQASRPRCGLASVPGRGGRAQARLQLVDLAGSECVGASGVTGVALREASSINRSLAALADVLGALSEGRSHVPYRNSKLTHLLQDSIGGDAKLLLLLCVSPGQRHAAETLQSLGFGARARQARRGGAGKTPSRSPEDRAGVTAEAGGESECGLSVPPPAGWGDG